MGQSVSKVLVEAYQPVGNLSCQKLDKNRSEGGVHEICNTTLLNSNDKWNPDMSYDIR